MSVPDFLVWRCAGCGAPAEGKKKPCNCATNVGVREGPNGCLEQTFWDDPPDPRDATIATLTAALEEARGALEDLIKYITREDPTLYGAIPRARTALATINAALGRVEG